MTMSSLILIVEDETPQAEALSYNLEKDGFKTIVAGTGIEAMELVEDNNPDLAIIDWMLPCISGIEVCRSLRSRKETRSLPIIILTARSEESDKILGLESGADDYMVKPYSPREIVARTRALLRRTNSNYEEEVLEYAGVAIDLSAHKVTRGGKATHLGPTEYSLLKTLMEKPGKVFTRNALLNKSWGRDINVEERTVDVHIRRLRKALNTFGGKDMIRTVRGVGYSIDTDVKK